MAENQKPDVAPKAPSLRDRSPSFPFISLGTAYVRLKDFEDYFKRHPAPASKAGLAWKMKENSSQAQQTLAALKAFGLLDYEGSGDDRRAFVTEEGRGYLRAQQDSIRREFAKTAALKPKIIEKYWRDWEADRPPDPVCLDTLVLKGGFTQASAATFLKVYDATLAFAGFSKSDKGKNDTLGREEPDPLDGDDPPPPPPPVRGNMNVTLNGDVIQVSAVLKDAEAVDKLIRVLQANKPMLPSAEDVRVKDGFERARQENERAKARGESPDAEPDEN